MITERPPAPARKPSSGPLRKILTGELEVAEGSPLLNRALSAIEVRSDHGFPIVGLRRPDGTTIVNPGPTTALAQGDVVIVLGDDDDIPQLAERFRPAGRDELPRRGHRAVEKKALWTPPGPEEFGPPAKTRSQHTSVQSTSRGRKQCAGGPDRVP